MKHTCEIIMCARKTSHFAASKVVGFGTYDRRTKKKEPKLHNKWTNVVEKRRIQMGFPFPHV